MSVQSRVSGEVSSDSIWLFLRHGESTANAARRLSGWEDVALTSRGQSQARSAGRELATRALSRVLTSDLRRAHHTAEICLREWTAQRQEPAPEIEVHEALRERNLGTFQGQELDHLRASGQTALLLGWASRPPQGESHADLAARALPLLASLPEETGPTLLVAHGGLLRTLLGLLDGTPLDQIGQNRIANATVIERRLAPGHWSDLSQQFGSS